MAEGMNAKFLRNPREFLRTHEISVPPNPVTPALRIPSPLANIDLVPVGGHQDQAHGRVRIENYDQRQHKTHLWSHPQPVPAYFLPARQGESVTILLTNQRNYMFTADLSGCLFAAYGNNTQTVMVEHVNAKALVIPRTQTILATNYIFCRLLTYHLPANADPAIVKTYTRGAWVIGLREGNSWAFYYKVAEKPNIVNRL